MKRRPLILALGVMLLVVIGAAAWYLASPLFIDRTVEEEFPISLPGESEMEEMSELERQSLATEVMETAQAMPDERMEEPMPTERAPEEVRTGDFVGADSFHQGSGQARIFVLADGTRLLRLEDFMVTNGPDLHVLLATEPSPAGQDDL
ncbi:MAG: DM13 domain-containing protein, partial [Thermoplasmata archaeon]|nr:DM13 domain-containing protein [Thermoplasmata archaeon]NIY05889.1 hypothetical protein [Thermoplasmata archaeon]